MSMVPSHEKNTENPEWTTENFAKTMPFSRLSDGLRAKLSVRGTQKTPIKERITIRLSGEVVERFRIRLANPYRCRPQGVARNAPPSIDKSGNG